MPTKRKRVIPRTDDSMTRIDIRVPNPLFEEIERLATERGEPIHHKSGRVTLAPTLLDLLQIGLAHYSPEAAERVSTKLVSDNNLDEVEERILAKLRKELDVMVKSRLPLLP